MDPASNLMSKSSVLRVAINAPLSRMFDYLPPASGSPAVGCRVRVPFGRQQQFGMIMQLADHSEVPLAKLRRAAQCIDDTPLLSDTDLWLIKFVSDYYHHPIGEVVAAALPAALRHGKSLYSATRNLSLTEDGAATDPAAVAKRAPRQAALMTLLRESGCLSFDQLDEAMPGWRRLKKAMAEKSLVLETTEKLELDVNESTAPLAADTARKKGPVLNNDQSAALRAIRTHSGFLVSLIEGVTGSGKTEIYLHLIQDVINEGKQALVIVPEIGLTPQLVNRFRDRLTVEPIVMHSALSDSARLSAWRSARSGKAQLIVGTRSAIFVPLENPGIIIVDEEHDSSLKQQESLRYSARDLAVVRGKRHAIPVVLGSATPSLESLQNCKVNDYQHLILSKRAGVAVPPKMRLVDLNKHHSEDGLSDLVISGIKESIAQRGQVLIFLNRRGFAPTLICSGCGNIAECARCDARMTVHAGKNKLICHHCGASRAIDTECADCGSTCKPLGQGTERLEVSLSKHFPQEAIARIDSDSTRAKGAMGEMLAKATSGEAQILVGTQMLSKGHHFPLLTLVVVINADQGLFSTDFRASERLAQSLVQVAGRAGRERRQGEVIIQTAFPTHWFWGELFDGGYERVAASALREREETVWPPFSKLALIRASSPGRDEPRQFLESVKQIAASKKLPGVRILGPVSAPMERRAGRYRTQLLLQSRQRKDLHELLSHLRVSLEGSKITRRVRWSIDVDPIELF